MKSLTRKDIAEGFRALGVPCGGALLIHTALSSFGSVEGGADTLIDGLLDALGPEGTLIVPTLTGHENLFPESPPHIDLRTAPAWIGKVPNVFLRRPEARRSIHPTHSCAAIGPRAQELTRGHQHSLTPCGITSPFFRNAAAGGQIALIGCGLDVCTTLHTVEELANVDWHLQKEVSYGSCIDATGRRIEVPCRLHSYAGPPRDYPALEPVLLERRLMRIGRVGASTVRLIDAMGLIETALELMARDPYHLTLRRKKEGPV